MQRCAFSEMRHNAMCLRARIAGSFLRVCRDDSVSYGMVPADFEETIFGLPFKDMEQRPQSMLGAP